MATYTTQHIPFSTNSLPTVPISVKPVPYLTEADVEWVEIVLTPLVVNSIKALKEASRQTILEASWRRTDLTDEEHLAFDLCLKNLQKKNIIYFNREKSTFVLSASNICNKCGAEVKVRALFFGEFTGCLC